MTTPHRFRRSIGLLLCAAAAGCGAPAADDPPRAEAVAQSNVVDRPQVRLDAAAQGEVPAESPPFALDYDAALAKAQAEGKPVLLFFTADWCAYCRQMWSDVATDPALETALADFVCVRIDVAALPRRCEEYRVRAYPTLVVATSRGVPLGRITGARSADRLAAELRLALAGMAERRTADESLQR